MYTIAVTGPKSGITILLNNISKTRKDAEKRLARLKEFNPGSCIREVVEVKRNRSGELVIA